MFTLAQYLDAFECERVVEVDVGESEQERKRRRELIPVDRRVVLLRVVAAKVRVPELARGRVGDETVNCGAIQQTQQRCARRSRFRQRRPAILSTKRDYFIILLKLRQS